mmetsp:Transcript_14136/g.30168  ORF Transcript_14136/g.30168 Transcript_14136/m.30168 type:complete len:357 (+) Transcript_14136:66-1136(+)
MKPPTPPSWKALLLAAAALAAAGVCSAAPAVYAGASAADSTWTCAFAPLRIQRRINDAYVVAPEPFSSRRINERIKDPDVESQYHRRIVTNSCGCTISSTNLSVQKSSSSDDRDLSPPWSFQASRIQYQFHLISSKVASKYCPSDDGVFLFNLFGVTLGGIFVVEYTDTPIGPYREVAFLCGLVGRLSGIGAWASHIVVDSEDAALYGERFWGLPAEVLPIDLLEGATGPTDVLLDEERVRVSGWTTTDNSSGEDTSGSIFWWLDIALPSFSGRLLKDNVSTDVGATLKPSPLLRYPLRIQSPDSISLVDNGSLEIKGTGRTQMELDELFRDSLPLVSLQIDNVRLTAGIATVESE